MTFNEKQVLLGQSMKLLMGHPPFMEFVDALRSMKEETLRSACSDKTFKTQFRTVGALGEVRAYIDILALVDEYSAKPEPESEAGSS